MISTLPSNSHIAVNGVQYRIKISGRGEPLVFLHGITGSSRNWYRHIEVLREHFTCISIDFLGHGGSDVPTDPARYRLDKVVADLDAMFDQMQLNKVNLLGYSMGGRVSLGYAVAQPKRLNSLILEGSSPGIDNEAERHARVQSDEGIAQLIELEGIEAFIDYWEKLPIFATQRTLPESVRADLRAQRLRNTVLGLTNTFRGLGTGMQPSLWNRLGELSVPVLMIVGELDTKYVGIAQRMESLIPNAAMHLVSGAGHTVHLEKPIEFISIVRDFLQQAVQGASHGA